MSVVMQRKSVRRYTDKLVSDENIKELMIAAQQAPSANNQQPWEFVVVTNKDTLTHLSKASGGAWMLADAPLGIIVVMKDDGKSPLMKPQDCGAAVENILLRAVELGLGAVWIGVYPLEDRMNYVNKALHITRGTAFAQIAIGYPADDKPVSVRFDPSRVHYETME